MVRARAVLADAPTMLRAEVGAQPLGLDGLHGLEAESPDAVRVRIDLADARPRPSAPCAGLLITSSSFVAGPTQLSPMTSRKTLPRTLRCRAPSPC